ncbi:MAG: endonuclease [Clostridia bacterium]
MILLKWLSKALLILAAVLIVLVVGLLGFLSITEYQPEDVEPVEITQAARNNEVQLGEMIKLVTFNTGYAGLDRDQDFFMDGGTKVQPDSKEEVEENLSSILSGLAQQNADVYFLQEVDRDSQRSYGIDAASHYQHGLSLNAAFAYNYKCSYVPYPLPPIGRVAGGIQTLTNLRVSEATRESLPVPFRWPIRLANLKRCLLVERVPVAGTEHELVLINLHMEAYDDGAGKAAQTRQLMDMMLAEYRNGNYVIAGGDFNQTFEGAQEAYPILAGSEWLPGKLENADLPKGFRYAFDASAPTCRLLNKPYDGDRKTAQFYVIDGFILSDNIKLNHVETIDLNFRNSDHNPVMIQVTPI